MSQLAIRPDFLDSETLGAVVRGLKGADTKAFVDDFRGDGPNGCGAPPGPGHLD